MHKFFVFDDFKCGYICKLNGRWYNTLMNKGHIGYLEWLKGKHKDSAEDVEFLNLVIVSAFSITETVRVN